MKFDTVDEALSPSQARPLRILHVIASTASGGAPVNVARLIERSSMHHFVVVQRDDDANWERLAGAAVGIWHLPIRRLRFKTLLRIVGLARRHSVDILHSHGRGAGLYGRLAGSILGIATVHTYRGFHNRFSGSKKLFFIWYERLFSLLTDCAVAVSSSERDKIVSAGVMATKKLHVVFNPIAIPVGIENAPLQLRPGVFNVMTLSRISPQKDVFTLIDAARLLGPDFNIHVFGASNASERAYESRVRERIADIGLESLILHGDVPGAAALMSSFDAYVSASRWEGLPTGIIESFLSGLPVVATDCAGNCDVVFHENTGLVCPEGDAEAIAAALQRLASDGELRQRLSRNAMSFARKEFNAQKLVHRMEDIYRSVAKNRGFV